MDLRRCTADEIAELAAASAEAPLAALLPDPPGVEASHFARFTGRSPAAVMACRQGADCSFLLALSLGACAGHPEDWDPHPPSRADGTREGSIGQV